MTLAPGSWPWLLRHEIRLAWRNIGGAHLGIVLGLGGLFWAALHVAAWALLRGVDTADLGPRTILVLGAVVGFVFTLMLSQAITLSVGVFFDRGDLDLLLASPLPARNVFIVRGLGVAVSVTAAYALFFLPLAHAGIVTGNARLLALYPAIASLGLLATAAGMALTLALVRLLGARRARTTAQLLGAFVGAAMFLVLQANNLVGRERAARWWAALDEATLDNGLLAPESAVWLPVQAMLGHPAALGLLVLAGSAAFALVVALTSRRFLAGTQESLVGTSAKRERNADRPLRLRTSLWRVVLSKEWKLLARDPQLIAQTLLQTLYLLPLVLMWSGQQALVALLVPATVLAATTLASGLAWLTVAAEDAPELVASAPVDLARLRRMKLVAALLPVWLIVAPMAVFAGATSAWTVLVLVACTAGGTISAGLIPIGLPRPGDRKNLLRRGKGDVLGGILEILTSIGWSGLAWCLLAAPRFAPLALLPALAGPATAGLLGRARRREFARG